MKKLLLVVFALGVPACKCAPEAPSEPPPIEVPPAADVKSWLGTVVELRGELWVGPEQLKVGDKIEAGQELDMRKGRATLDIAGVGTVRLFPKTRARFVSLSKVRLWIGKIWSKVAPIADREYVVETPNAVAGVRGTAFYVAHRDQQTRVAVNEGQVAVVNARDPQKEVLVAAGSESLVRQDQPPTAPKTFDTTSDEEQWEQAAELESELPADPQPPKPQVVPDRKAFEKHERKGEQQRKKLKEESKREKKKLKQEEKKVRDSFKDKKRLQQEMEEGMGTKGSLKGKKGTLRQPKKKGSIVDDL